MSEQGGQEKEHPATPKRRDEARRKGQVAQSREISSAMILLAVLGFFALFGRRFCMGFLDTAARQWSVAGSIDLNAQMMKPLIYAVSEPLLALFLPLFGIVVVVGIATNVAQVGLVFSGYPLIPKPDKIDPVSGTKRLFSPQSLVELLKSLAKIALVGTVGVQTLMSRKDELIPLMIQPPIEVMAFSLKLSLLILFKCSLALVLIAALDYAFQRYSHEKKLRMSRQEVKDELKDVEGNPQVKARVRRIMTDQAMRRMMQEVPKSDVVVTNPTRLAVALKYDAQTMAAPRVVAKGKGLIAGTIRRRAQDSGVPILERPPLARTLYASVKVGGAIPRNLYNAVAEVLAYVYRIKEAV